MLAHAAHFSRASGSGSPEGRLSLRFEAAGRRTVLAGSYSSSPFRVFAHNRLADGALVVQVTMLGPGIASNDVLTQHISVGAGGHAIVLFTSATKLLGSTGGGRGRQDISIEVAGDGALEYYPGLTIPYPNANYMQRTRVDLAPSARFGMLELWATGRVQRGEALLFQSLDARTEISVGDRPAYADALVLQPQRHNLASLGLLESASYVASGYWKWAAALPLYASTTIHNRLATGVPGTGDLYLRGLARDGLALRKEVQALLRRQRDAWGLAPLDLQRYAPSFA